MARKAKGATGASRGNGARKAGKRSTPASAAPNKGVVVGAGRAALPDHDREAIEKAEQEVRAAMQQADRAMREAEAAQRQALATTEKEVDKAMAAASASLHKLG